eukprot:GFUD01016245.1.p1 GENE.GFUD01016245.1~~GFUD01016245.1.p1  ORF type:complete len:913 (+),score=201.86 GFUD01016245.1:85-2823(+)
MSTITGEEANWGRVGNGLNTINRFLQKYVQMEIKTHFQNLPRISGPAHAFIGCLADSNGEPLRFDPENHPTPPQGDGVQLCYRALPHYEDAVKDRTEKIEEQIKQNQPQLSPSQIKLKLMERLPGKNQPTPIIDEHELAHLYLQEYYKRQSNCNISNLDASAILNILSKASCFPGNVRKQAAHVRDTIRNSWAHCKIEDWVQNQMDIAFAEMEKLAQMMPNNEDLLKELDEDLKGTKKFEFPMKEFLLKINRFRTDVKNGKHEKIQTKIKKLENFQSKEIYIPRRFKESNGIEGNQIQDVEKLVLEKKTTLLKGVAGSGKTSVSVKTIQQWAKGEHLKNITCCLFLAAGSDAKIPLFKMVWDTYSEVGRWEDHECKESFHHLQTLADQGSLVILIDGIDELGTMTKADVDLAARAAIHPALEVDIRTTCVGIMTQKILPGAFILATGRITEMVNQQVLEEKAMLYELLDLTQEDRQELVVMMEEDPNERNRINNELDRVATAGNELFLKTPLMTKNIIELVINKKVEIERTKNSSEIYLMLLMKNLDFHTDRNESFTELDPPEDHEYLIMCLKLCQHHLQTNEGTEGINTIKGIQRNVKNMGQCFEANALSETISVPLEFIKKLGIFQIRKEGGNLYLDAVHLSYFEFCCAAALCRNNLDIEEELSKITDLSRFKAVVLYLSGMFAPNDSIKYLIACQDICQNFMDLLKNNEKEKSFQAGLRAIMTRKWEEDGTKAEFVLTTQEKIMMGYDQTFILAEARKANSSKIILFDKIHLQEVKNLKEVKSVVELIKVQHGLNKLDIDTVVCDNTEDSERLVELLKMVENWKVDQVIGNSSVRSFRTLSGQKLRSIDIGSASCGYTSEVLVLCSVLKQFVVWRAECLDLYNITKVDWTALSCIVESGGVGTVKVTNI